MPDPKLRSLISLLLTDAGAVVAACKDDEEVLRVAGSRFCQLCVLALGVAPDMGELIGALRHLSPDTRVLLITGREDIDAVLPLYPRGLSDTLLQPINPKRAVSTLHRLLGKPAPAGGSTPPFAGSTPPAPIPGGSAPPFAVAAAAATEMTHRPVHLIVRSPVMQRTLGELWTARNDPLGVVLRGEPGAEFELAAREFQAMGGDPSGYLVVINHQELNVETLATQVSLDRLKEGLPRTYFIPEIEKLPKEQEKPLLDFLRRARRQRDREKPLRIVFAANECDDEGRSLDGEFLEELQFIMPAVVRVPPLRERRDDVEPIARRVMLDLATLFPDRRARSIHPSAMQWLMSRSWTGNHRELVDVMRRAVLECPNRELTPVHFGKLVEETPDPDEVAAARVLAAVAGAALPRR